MKFVETLAKRFEGYRSIVDQALIDEVQALAKDLRGARIVHVNATATGSGVAEILHSIVPLYHDLGFNPAWLVLEGDDDFVGFTKQLHNALQGAERHFTPDDRAARFAWNERNAEDLDGNADVIFVHDPQPAALRRFVSDRSTRWIWRSHIDTMEPHPDAWSMVRDIVNEGYNEARFSMGEFVGPGLRVPHVAIVPPAPQNVLMATAQAETIV